MRSVKETADSKPEVYFIVTPSDPGAVNCLLQTLAYSKFPQAYATVLFSAYSFDRFSCAALEC